MAMLSSRLLRRVSPRVAAKLALVGDGSGAPISIGGAVHIKAHASGPLACVVCAAGFASAATAKSQSSHCDTAPSWSCEALTVRSSDLQPGIYETWDCFAAAVCDECERRICSTVQVDWPALAAYQAEWVRLRKGGSQKDIKQMTRLFEQAVQDVMQMLLNDKDQVWRYRF
eukprot:gnl/TRDRNA2_/TRDRNA2_36530_c0_seq1.p1 gnl/TRDRNA2_/TRDRNA2_36530_c0~~gnl/TRDRNA2_/TRDRNA2_36530_c0_seq1.p1  ORF type:complete len:171 (-),score=24.74 gnl/TRDRNA2_/TRDRNA2_36530_c0_seq1:592-1104(-)